MAEEGLERLKAGRRSESESELSEIADEELEKLGRERKVVKKVRFSL